ncbi:MAG: class I SAM-dependent methyltransferase [Nitrospinales bacterium]
MMKNAARQARRAGAPEPSCPLCRAETVFFLRRDRREYRQCPDCRLIFVPPRFFLPRDKEIERYLQHENSLENPGYVKMFQDKIEIVKSVCPDVRKTLDYGCGYEPVLQTLLSRAGYEAEGYDVHFFPGDDLKPGYDLIISTETFEHFKEPGREINRIVSLLSPRGFLAVMTRFYPEEGGRVSRESFQNWYYQRDPTHVAFYSPGTFAWVAKDRGLKIVFDNRKDFVILRRAADENSFF